tara:strand:- start:1 stop:504 length:504 start_codon:yes stop_codon:yes gene_type:complete
MVKNTAGGSKHKSMARKNVNQPPSSRIRVPEEEGEYFAKVTKMLGNGMCHVTVFVDGELLENVICFIRGKFKSRNKKQNFVSVESFLIVGMRQWATNHNQCDLLHVFDSNSISTITSLNTDFASFYQLTLPILHNSSDLSFIHNSHFTHHSQHSDLLLTNDIDLDNI